MNNIKNKFSIIIPTKNRAESLDTTLTHLINLDFDKEKFEIIIVDNDSKDATKEVVGKYFKNDKLINLKYFYETEPGQLSGRHRGANESSADILVFIDDDIKVDKDWLTAIDEAFSDPLVEIVGGKNLPDYEIPPPNWLKWFWVKHKFGRWCAELSLLDFGNLKHEISPIFVFGLNFSIRKKTFLKLRGFNPDVMPKELQYFQGDGETGLAKKAILEKCKTIYQPKAIVYHAVTKDRMTEEYFYRRYFYQGVTKSYSEIRYNKSFQETEKTKKRCFLKKIRHILWYLKKIIIDFSMRKEPEEFKILKEKMKQAEIDGFNYHKRSVNTKPQLLKWVLKDDYMDYKLPKIQ